MKCLAISDMFLTVLVGAVVYNVFLPLSSAISEDSLLLTTAFYCSFMLVRGVEKFGITPTHKTSTALLPFAYSDEDTGQYIKDTKISGVSVRIYRRKRESSQDQMLRPALIYFHGGGLVFGAAKSGVYDKFCSTIAEGTKSVVISVEYRLAPEHKFPAGFLDCYAVVTATIKEAKKFGIIKDKIAIGGDSAGGLLAAAVSLQLAKDSRSKDIAAQLLIYPWVQCIDITCLSSYQKYPTGYGVAREEMAFFCTSAATGNSDFKQVFISGNVSRYFMDTPYWKSLEIPEGSKCNIPVEKPTNIPSEIIKAVVDPRLSPLLADSVEGSPPTFMVSAEYDPLASEGDLYARRLKKAGIPVIQKKYKGYHGFINNIANHFATIPVAEEAMQDMVNCLNSTFYKT